MSFGLGYPGAGRGGRGSVRAVLTTSPPNFYVPPNALTHWWGSGRSREVLGALCARLSQDQTLLGHQHCFQHNSKTVLPWLLWPNDLYPSQTSTGLQGTWKVGNRCKVLGKPGAGSFGWARGG